MKCNASSLFQNYVEGSNGTFGIGPILLWAPEAFSGWFSSLAPDAEGTTDKGLILTGAGGCAFFQQVVWRFSTVAVEMLVREGIGEHVSDWVRIQPHSQKSKARAPLSFLHLDRMCHLKCELVTQPRCVSVSSSGERR